MNSIINPMVFYCIDLFSNLNEVVFVIMILSLFVVGIIGFVFFDMETGFGYDEDDEDFKKVKKVFSISSIILIVSISLNIFIPSEQTMYKMLIAKYSTPNNIEAVIDYIDESVEKILEVKNEQ